MPLNPQLQKIKGRNPKVLVLGSGGLTIGQAGEFDYSGTQCIKALRDRGFEIIVINPNIATVQTNPQEGVKVYLYPVEPEHVVRILKEENVDAIIGGFGGQTALNCLLKLDEQRVLDDLGILNLGTPVESIRLTEDRKLFAQKMREVGLPVAPGATASSIDEALGHARQIGYPVMVRASFALGGLSSGIAQNENEFRAIAQSALFTSHEILIEKALHGWKEVEYEVMRDSRGNAITICNMENIDPLGIHTGDSIVVVPSQTLVDEEYQRMRDAAIKVADSMGVIGECNVQFALDPKSYDFCIIEVNARLSRSSALASKASGYPIAYIAAQVVIGFELTELKNPVTGISSALYEPALDYVTVKMPRWDLAKFDGASRKLGTSMKSVGEVMAIGRTFEEALQKSVRMVSERGAGLSETFLDKIDDLEEELQYPTDVRVFAIVEAFRNGISVDEVSTLTKIEPWFLSRMKGLVELEDQLSKLVREVANQETKDREIIIAKALSQMEGIDWKRLKVKGFGDEQIAYICLKALNSEGTPVDGDLIRRCSVVVRGLRKKKGVVPYVKKIDTTAGEYLSPSNYLFLSYAASHDEPGLDRAEKKTGAVILGGGSYRIGSSVEFDWSSVGCSKQLRKAGWRSIVVNCNPETVSTDYSNSDRLYFEEISLERILDICEFEGTNNVIACMGGQLPNCLAVPLSRVGVELIGHSPESIDLAEDRSRFSNLLDKLNINQPRWKSIHSRTEVDTFVKEIGYPLLVRPSYVLSGAGMKVVHTEEQLTLALKLAHGFSSERPIVISEFFDGARELEFDGVAAKGRIVAGVISEHVENAGVHSGDATLVLPPHRASLEIQQEIKGLSKSIAKELKLNGPFNIQFLARDGKCAVIECNARASRSLPFVSKVIGLDLAELATRVLLGETDIPAVDVTTARSAVKSAVFSFNRIVGSDPLLKVEMASTGEVGCLGMDTNEALRLAFEASGIRIPKKGVLVSSGPQADKDRFLAAVSILSERKIPVYATPGTARHLADHGQPVKVLDWPDGSQKDVLHAIKAGWVDFVINIPKDLERAELEHSAIIRKTAIKFGCSLLTDMEKTVSFLQAIDQCRREMSKPQALTNWRILE